MEKESAMDHRDSQANFSFPAACILIELLIWCLCIIAIEQTTFLKDPFYFETILPSVVVCCTLLALTILIHNGFHWILPNRWHVTESPIPLLLLWMNILIPSFIYQREFSLHALMELGIELALPMATGILLYWSILDMCRRL